MTAEYVEKITARAEKDSFLCGNALEMLPLGDITCKEGWLCEQLRLVGDGITGRLPEYGPYFRREKNGFLFPDVKSGWEEVPYWLRGFYPLAVLTGEEKLLKIANQYMDALLLSVQEDGWFGPAYLKDLHDDEEGNRIPDLFPNMLLTDTLMLYYSHTRDEKVLAILGKYFRFLMKLNDRQFLPPVEKGYLRWQKIRCGDLLNQIYWYYRNTKDAAVLPLAERVHGKIVKSISGYVANHAVDFAMRFAYDAIYSQQSKKESDFLRSEKEYQIFADEFGQMPRGIFAADEQIRKGATDPRQAYEPCGMVELAKNFYLLERMTGDTLYADRTEDILFNHFPASFTPDYHAIHYLTAANSPILSVDTEAASCNGKYSHDRSYQIMTPNNRCCGHNTGMGWPWYTMNLWQKTADGGIAACLYAPCEIHTELHGQKIDLEVKTNYPFGESIDVIFGTGGEYPVYFRIPGWCRKAALEINGKQIMEEKRSGGWIRTEKEWKAGDKIRLLLPMEISFTKWKSNGSVSVDRGPLTYSVRIREQYKVLNDALAYNHPEPHLFENFEVLPLSDWNYGFVLNQDGNPDVQVERIDECPAKQPFTEKDAPVVLRAKAKKIPLWQLQDSCPAELQKGPIISEEPEETIEMIPLGCARLRMSCLPVIGEGPEAKPWKPVPAHIPFEERPSMILAQYDWTEPESEEVAGKPWKPEDEK